MASISTQNYRWIIVILFLGLIIAPAQVQSPTIKIAIVVAFGGGCLLFELLSLKSLSSNEVKYKSKFTQTLILIALTILLLVVNFVI